MLLTNAHLISPGLEIEDGFVQVDGETISALGPMSEAPSDEGAIDLAGQMLLPGFIDIHAHGADGHDVCDASAESLQHIAKRKLQEGVTTWLPTTLTLSEERLVEVVSTVADWAPSAPLSVPGMHLEGPFVNPCQAGAQNPDFMRAPDPAELRRLHDIFPALLLSLAPELPGALDLIREARSLGITASAAHTDASYEDIAEAIGYGLTHLTHFGNAMTGLHHRKPGVVGAGLMEDSLMLELIADGVHLADDMLRLILKVVPHERLMLITDSVAASWQGEGSFLLGELEVTIKDSIARLADGSLAGSALQYHKGFQRIAGLSDLPLSEIVAMTSFNQAQSLGLRDRGELALGKRADLVVLNADFEVQETIVAGMAV